MFKKANQQKQHEFKISGISVGNLHGFFIPYVSFKDFRKQLRSPILMPIIDLFLSVNGVLNTLRKLCETAVNIVLLAPIRAGDSFSEAFSQLATAVYFAVSAVTDTLRSLTALATRTLTTAAYGVAIVACGVGLLACHASSVVSSGLSNLSGEEATTATTSPPQ